MAAGILNINGKFNKGDHIKILDKNIVNMQEVSFL